MQRAGQEVFSHLLIIYEHSHGRGVFFFGEKKKNLLNLAENRDPKIMRKQKLNTFRVVTRHGFSRMTLITH